MFNSIGADQIKSLMGEIIRIGEVTSTDDEAGTARVQFKDRNGVVSYNLPVIVRNTLENKDYWMPDIKEQVLCLFLPIGIEQGFILGSYYSKVNTPPASTKNKRLVTFQDGTTIEYDRETHTLTADVKGDINVIATGDISATVQGSATINVDGDVTAIIGGSASINVTGNVSATVSGSLNADVSGGSTIKTPTLTVDGNLVVTGSTQTVGLSTTAGLSSTGGGGASISGNVSVTSGDVNVDGISVKTHTHISASSGNPTGPAQ